MNSSRYNRQPALKVAPHLRALGRTSFALNIITMFLGMATFFLAVLAMSGKRTTKIDFHPSARAIQGSEIAMVRPKSSPINPVADPRSHSWKQ